MLLILILITITTPIASADPEPRMGPGLIYDEANHRLILVSGAYDSGQGWNDYRDMWTYDGVWSELSTAGIPASNNFEMVYSPDPQQIIVFTNNNDYTYTYDIPQNRWSLHRQTTGPIKRGDAAFCYDPTNKVIIMYGGLTDANVDPRILNDTWAYDPQTATWTEMSPVISPPRTYGCRMIYDTQNQAMLLWGGNLPQTIGAKLDDWWKYEYQSNTWTKIETENKPPMRYWQYMAYDPKIGKVVMYGGSPEANTDPGDTWLYDYATNQWNELNPTVSPPEGQCGGMVYYPEQGGIVLFGGIDERTELGELWRFNAESGDWSRVQSSASNTEEEEPESGIPGFPITSTIITLILLVTRLSHRGKGDQTHDMNNTDGIA